MKRIERKGFWLGVSFLMVFGLARVWTISAGARQDIVGKKAPAIEVTTVAGKPFSLEKMHGKVVVLDFWAVWCGPCVKSMPFFQTLSEKYAANGLEVVGVHVDDRMPPPEEVGTYLKKLGVSYTNLISTLDVDNEFMIYAMPTTYLIDREGIIVKRHIGFNPGKTPERLEEDIRGLLGLD